MATLLYPGKEFKITHQEMIKGISRGQTGKKYRYHDELVVPIIENTPEERDLTVSNKKFIYYCARTIGIVRTLNLIP
jgi:methylthioribulose-1-phosphate dehydratase